MSEVTFFIDYHIPNILLSTWVHEAYKHLIVAHVYQTDNTPPPPPNDYRGNNSSSVQIEPEHMAVKDSYICLLSFVI